MPLLLYFLKNSVRQSFGVDLLSTSPLSFPSFKNVFNSPLSLKDIFSDIRYWTDYSFLLVLEKCVPLPSGSLLLLMRNPLLLELFFLIGIMSFFSHYFQDFSFAFS